MPSHDRPYFEGQRERGFRDRDRGFGRRNVGRRDEDDDRGSWMSRDRDDFERRRDYRDRDPFDPRQDELRRGRQAFEPDFEPRREHSFGREQDRFEPFEDWERPRDLERESGSQRGDYSEEYRRSFGRAPQNLPGYRGGYSGYDEPGRSFSMGRSAWEQRGQESHSQRRFGFGRFAGRGPKGYQRSDERLKEDICERLTAHPEIDAAEIEVLVQGSEVTLQGSVPERAMKRAAEDTAEEITGVQQVHNRLRVESRESGEDDHGGDRFAAKSSEGQRSSAGRKAH